MNAPICLPPEILKQRDALADLRQRIAAAKLRAGEIAAERETAEAAHASAVATAILTGEAMPAKPSALSRSEAADDAVESALALLAVREATAAGDLGHAEAAWVEAMLLGLHAEIGQRGRTALANCAAALHALSEVLGRNLAVALVETMTPRLPASDPLTVPLSALRPDSSVGPAIGGWLNNRGGDLRILGGWPAPADAERAMTEPVAVAAARAH